MSPPPLQVAFNPASRIPMVGASGAISGVMGAYLILSPRVRVFTLVPIGFFLTSIALPAWTMLLYWALLQFLGGFTGSWPRSEAGWPSGPIEEASCESLGTEWSVGHC